MWNPRRVASCMTRSGKPQVPQEKAEQTHQKRLSKSLPHPQQEERKKTQYRCYRKKPPNRYTGTTREGGLQVKHPRLATLGQREEENRQAEQERQHQKCSLGIKAKIPKKIRRPQTSAKIAKLGKKTPQHQHCLRLTEESAQRPMPTQR